jgi:hypothetical protein
MQRQIVGFQDVEATMDQAEGNTNQTKTNRDSGNAKPPTDGSTVVRPELNAEATKEAKADAECKKEPTLKNDWHRPLGIPITEWLVAFFTLVIMASSIIYTVYAKKQWKVMRESNKTNREALVSVQRAFVFVGGNVRPNTFGDTLHGITAFTLRFTWENSGATPANPAIQHFSFQAMPGKMPDNFGFPDLWAPNATQITTPTAIGPHGTVDTIVGPISTDHVKLMQANKEHLYFWGWSRYRDAFENTAEHITRVCYEMIRFDGNIFSVKPVVLEPILQECDVPYTCYDVQCTQKQ